MLLSFVLAQRIAMIENTRRKIEGRPIDGHAAVVVRAVRAGIVYR